MALAVGEDIPTFFDKGFVDVDESDATSADFQAPKKENRWCLVEMSKEQVEALQAGQLFHIKAHTMNASAALCTGDQTWSLEFLENSNPMYLGSVSEVTACEPGKATAENEDPNAEGAVAGKEPAAPSKQCTIFAQCRGHILLKPTISDSKRLRDLLSAHSVDGGMEEGAAVAASGSKAMTTSCLQYQVAASPKELKTLLDEGPYVQNDGAWSWMPAAFEREVTDVSLNLISLKNWDLACIDVKALLLAAQEHFGEDGARHLPSTDVLLNALRGVASAPAVAPAAAPAAASAAAPAAAFAAAPAAVPAAAKTSEGQTGESPPVLQEGKLSLDPEKICLFQATQLLRESPSRLRERFELQPPASRAKRPKLGAASSAAGNNSALQVEEFCAAFSALAGKETTIEELCKILGNCMYIDEMDGAVHALDVMTLPQEPRERLKRLFELSSHWKPDRLTKMLTPTLKGVKIDAWVMKYTKTVYLEFEKGKEVRMLTKKFAGLN